MADKLERLAILPHPRGSLKSEGRIPGSVMSAKVDWTDWIGSLLTESIKDAFNAPGKAARGEDTGVGDALNFALNVIGGGSGAGSATGAGGAGTLGMAILNKARLEKLATETAYAHQPKTKTALTTMTPSEFLSLTAKEAWKPIISEEAGVFNPARFNAESQYPYLNIEAGAVVGHEGRHRLSGLLNSGYDSQVPVVLRTSTARTFDDLLSYMFSEGPQLRGQYSPYQSVTPSSPAVALHPDNMTELLKFVNDSMLTGGGK